MDDEYETLEVITTVVTYGNNVFYPVKLTNTESEPSFTYSPVLSRLVQFICSIESRSQKSNLEPLRYHIFLLY